MQGNILITVLILLAILSLSTLYSARESLWAVKGAQTERDALQLDVFIDEALVKVEQLIQSLPMEINPVHESECTGEPCVLLAGDANIFLEQDLQLWLAQNNPVPITFTLSWPQIQGRVILEQLATDTDVQYFRSTILLQSDQKQAQLRMQATWKRTTLMLGRLAWR